MTIDIKNLPNLKPYSIFKKFYNLAIENNQKYVEAISISSFNKDIDEVQSRMVNLKYIQNEEWIFFSNYLSPKSKSFETHDQIAATFYWNSINTQIRVKAKIKKTSREFSDSHYLSRAIEKNALAISSNQSNRINSYQEVIDNYNLALKNYENELKRPEYWGGFSFTPYYFEFWEGNEYRINKREVFSLKGNDWENFLLQP